MRVIFLGTINQCIFCHERVDIRYIAESFPVWFYDLSCKLLETNYYKDARLSFIKQSVSSLKFARK